MSEYLQSKYNSGSSRYSNYRNIDINTLNICETNMKDKYIKIIDAICSTITNNIKKKHNSKKKYLIKSKHMFHKIEQFILDNKYNCEYHYEIDEHLKHKKLKSIKSSMKGFCCTE
jgi:hypothetical protein